MIDDIEVNVDLKGETSLAYKINNGDVEVWVPKSKVSDICMDKGKMISIFIPEWLAIDKGLV